MAENEKQVVTAPTGAVIKDTEPEVVIPLKDMPKADLKVGISAVADVSDPEKPKVVLSANGTPLKTIDVLFEEKHSGAPIRAALKKFAEAHGMTFYEKYPEVAVEFYQYPCMALEGIETYPDPETHAPMFDANVMIWCRLGSNKVSKHMEMMGALRPKFKDLRVYCKDISTCFICEDEVFLETKGIENVYKTGICLHFKGQFTIAMA